MNKIEVSRFNPKNGYFERVDIYDGTIMSLEVWYTVFNSDGSVFMKNIWESWEGDFDYEEIVFNRNGYRLRIDRVFIVNKEKIY